MRSVPVLMYHHVSPAAGLVTVSPRTFTSHVEMLARKGYATLNAAQFLAYLEGRDDVPKKSVVITFDDGYLDNYLYAYPILKKFGLHAIIFAVTSWIGGGAARPLSLPDICADHSACKTAIREGQPDKVMLRWSEIELMQDDGTIEVHSHTHAHVRWDELYPTRAEACSHLRVDLEHSLTSLQARLGDKSYHLCWPWGRFNPEYQNIARDLGFVAQYSVDPEPNLKATGTQKIGRIAVKEASATWLARRLWLYSSATRAKLYNRLAGKPSVYG